MTATHDNAGIAAWNFKLKGEVKSCEQARAFVQENDPDGVMAELGPKMHVLLLGDGHGYSEDVYAVVLYNTEIIRYYPDGTFSVDNGGHNTLTTRERLQAVLPDGFGCYHFSTKELKGKLGLTHFKRPFGQTSFPKRRKVQTADTLWPLDHSRRITMEGEFA